MDYHSERKEIFFFTRVAIFSKQWDLEGIGFLSRSVLDGWGESELGISFVSIVVQVT